MAEVRDDMRGVWPPLSGVRMGLSLVVDDLGVRVRAIHDMVVGECGTASDMAMQKRTAIGCVASVGDGWAPGGKTVTARSSQEVLRRLQTSMRSLGLGVRRRPTSGT